MIEHSRYRARQWVSVTLVLMTALAVTGCQKTGVRTDMTLDVAEKTTAAQIDALIARIDPALIDRIDAVTDDSFGCRGLDIDPDQLVRQWENRRYVVFVVDVSPLEGLALLDDLVTEQVADGWTLARDNTADGDGGRRVQLVATNAVGGDDEVGYGLSVSGGGEVAGQTSLNISATSPCFEAVAPR
jgi:hypothetical protein